MKRLVFFTVLCILCVISYSNSSAMSILNISRYVDAYAYVTADNGFGTYGTDTDDPSAVWGPSSGSWNSGNLTAHAVTELSTESEAYTNQTSNSYILNGSLIASNSGDGRADVTVPDNDPFFQNFYAVSNSQSYYKVRFVIETDEVANFDLTYVISGYNSDTPEYCNFGYTKLVLLDTSAEIFKIDAEPENPGGLNSSTYTESGTLLAGTYDLIVDQSFSIGNITGGNPHETGTWDFDFTANSQVVPLPTSLLLLASGLLGLVGFKRKKSKR